MLQYFIKRHRDRLLTSLCEISKKNLHIIRDSIYEKFYETLIGVEQPPHPC